MKYALLTDNSVQWFTDIVSILDTGEVNDYKELDTEISNEYLSNIFNKELSFTSLKLTIPGQSLDTWYGTWISEYDFKRIARMIELFPAVKEYYRLGKIEKI